MMRATVLLLSFMLFSEPASAACFLGFCWGGHHRVRYHHHHHHRHVHTVVIIKHPPAKVIVKKIVVRPRAQKYREIAPISPIK